MDISICIPVEDARPIFENNYYLDDMNDGLDSFYQDIIYHFLDGQAISVNYESSLQYIFQDGNNVWMKFTFNNSLSNLHYFGYNNLNEDLRGAQLNNTYITRIITVYDYDLDSKIYPNTDIMLSEYTQYNHNF
jgi:hypothetical protein